MRENIYIYIIYTIRNAYGVRVFYLAEISGHKWVEQIRMVRFIRVAHDIVWGIAGRLGHANVGII